jgi:ribonucleoside-diphosphate reductase alpha chain
MYSREEAFKECLIYFNGDELAANVFIDKYALKDKQGNLLEKDPEDMHRRMTHEFKKIEDKYPNPMSYLEIFELFNKFKYIIPGGSQMAGVGNNTAITSLSNCFVIDSAIDSYGGIMRADEEQIQIMKRRGGVGHDLSNLRPSGVSANNSTLGQMAGATLYMDRFSNSTREVAQDGRRGALMLSIDVRHPDCDKFIDAKLKEGKVIGANISVRISDDFMKAVEEDGDFIQTFPIFIDLSKFSDCYDLNHFNYNTLYKIENKNREVCYIKHIKAKELWNKIIKNAHQSAEPGVLFWNTIIKESPADYYGEQWKTISTNPCFTGDTIIAVADGRNGVSIKELSDKNEQFIVYSAKPKTYRKEGWVTEIKKAIAFKTGHKKVLKLVLSNGSSFKCTSDHLLALSNKMYIKAIDSIGLKLEKFYTFSNKNDNKSYRHINSKSNGYARQYRLIWEYFNGKYDGSFFNVDHKNDNSKQD